jgi:glycolate oxidase FAD binding subunit
MTSMQASPSSHDFEEFTPTTQDELRRFLSENFAGPQRPLTLAGGRTALDYGGPLSKPTVTVGLSQLDRVVDYPARDMTITVEAGIRIDRLAEVLKAEGQRLPIDIPQSSRATLGGALATNISGPRRFTYGTFRDYVIGLTAMTADGRVFHSGGRVVKNVAGYDLCKLMVGSLGTLAVVTQVTLKLKPIPESSLLVCANFEKPADRDAAVSALLNSETRPVAIDTLNPQAAALVENQASVGLPPYGSTLLVGFEGAAHESDWQAETLQREMQTHRPKAVAVIRRPESDRLWTALTEFPLRTDDSAVFKASLLPSKVPQFEDQASRAGLAVLSHAGDGAVIAKLPHVGRDELKMSGLMTTLGATATEGGGSLESLHGVRRDRGSNQDRGSAAGALLLMRKLKEAFDPAGLLNPGRLPLG